MFLGRGIAHLEANPSQILQCTENSRHLGRSAAGGLGSLM
jgi:hypothetical protein